MGRGATLILKLLTTRLFWKRNQREGREKVAELHTYQKIIVELMASVKEVILLTPIEIASAWEVDNLAPPVQMTFDEPFQGRLSYCKLRY